MTTPISKTPEKNIIKAVVDSQGIPIGIEAQIDGIGLSVPVEKFCASNAESSLPRATFTANGIHREIFVDSAKNTAYVRSVREKDITVVVETEEVHNIVIEHFEKSAKIAIDVKEKKDSTQPTPTPSPVATLPQGILKLDKNSLVVVVPSLFMPMPPSHLGIFVFMNSNTTESIAISRNTAQPITATEIGEGDRNTTPVVNLQDTTERHFATPTIPSLVITATPEDSSSVPGQTELIKQFATELPHPRMVDLNYGTTQGADHVHTMNMTDSVKSEPSLRTMAPLRGPGLFEKLSSLIASFKQTFTPTRNIQSSQIIIPLFNSQPQISAALRADFKDQHYIDHVPEGEGSRDSSDGQRQSQDEHHEEQQHSSQDQEQYSETSA